MNEFARFEANAFHNARKYAEQREAEEEKEKEFAKCLNNLARFYSNEEMAMFYRIKNIDGVMSAEILLVVRNDSGTTDIIEEVPLNMSVKDFEGKVREICEEAERIKEEK